MAESAASRLGAAPQAGGGEGGACASTALPGSARYGRDAGARRVLGDLQRRGRRDLGPVRSPQPPRLVRPVPSRPAAMPRGGRSRTSRVAPPAR